MRFSLAAALLAAAAARAFAACPPEMADVDGRFCIDKWEASVVDKASGQDASPYYTLDAAKGYPGARWQKAHWAALPNAKYPLPELPAVEAADGFVPMAVSRPGVYPQGFATRATAALACRNAGKRLCRHEEWYKACVGRSGPPFRAVLPARAFPYGADYAVGKCNFNLTDMHPLVALSRSSSQLDDPRLMTAVDSRGSRMLAKTGEFKDCVSDYGVYDLVGNQDEIVDSPPGKNELFVGSFYARDQSGNPNGCASAINAHADGYFDYSLGFRCCADEGP